MRAGLGTFGALLARDVRVLRRQFGQFLLRTMMQPFLFVFVFAYVFPKIGQGFRNPAGGSFTTVLVPGLIAVAINFQGIQAVALPLVQEFSVSKEIEDRVLSPVPVWTVGLEKIVAGAIQSVLAALVVFPIVYLVHSHGAAPTVHIDDVAALHRRARVRVAARLVDGALHRNRARAAQDHAAVQRRPDPDHLPRLRLLPVVCAEADPVVALLRARQPARLHDRRATCMSDPAAAAHAGLGHSCSR